MNLNRSDDARGNLDDWEDPTLSESVIFGLSSFYRGFLVDGIPIDTQNIDSDDSRIRLAASVFANAHDGIVIADATRKVLDINRAYLRNTGVQPNELIGKKLFNSGSVHHPPSFFEALWHELDRSDFWRGEIRTTDPKGRTRTDLVSLSAVRNSREELTHYVAIFSDVSAMKEIQKKLEHLAYHDPLTGLPNRVLLHDRIKQALARIHRHGLLAAICYIDLDDFKPVNDLYGHDVGDRVLVEVADRLSDCLREEDSVARLGGDEFALLLCDLNSRNEALDILSRLLHRVSQPYRIDGNELSLSASIGYTLAPDDSGDPDTLLRHADQAMYQSKQRGRNQFTLFDRARDERVRNRNQTIARISRALENNEFRLLFQPKVDIRIGKVVGLEALIRWQHPDRGLIGPAEFLLPLGNHPILIPIGEWVIRTVLQQARAWMKENLKLPISINIAACHLLHPDFVARLGEELASHQEAAHGLIELEILETAAIEDIDHVANVLNECLELGVTAALDDFGTGYSSLLYLKRLPANTLKIDRSFVQDILESREGSDTISGIMGLARAFRRQVVAEGVETIEQGIVLLRLGCDVIQGFAVARPLPPESVPEWVAGYKPDSAWRSSIDIPWRRSDLPLLIAELDQRRWLALAKAAVARNDPNGISAILKETPQTPFGHWLETLGVPRYSHLEEFKRLPELLAKVHRIRESLLNGINNPGTEGLPELLKKHKAASFELYTALRDLRAEIAQKLPRGAPAAPASTFGSHRA